MDHTLDRYYRSAMSRAAFVIALPGYGLAVLSGRLVGIWTGSDVALSLVLKALRLGVSLGAVILMYLTFERFVRGTLWRWAYPERVLAGTWHGATTYSRIHHCPEMRETVGDLPRQEEHTIRFEQDCLSISVAPTNDKPFSGTWHSTVAAFIPSPVIEVEYSYEVNYDGSPEFPTRTRGVERVKVIGGQNGEVPMTLAGHFSHLAFCEAPVYSGTVKFERRSECGADKVLPGRSKFVRTLYALLAKLTKPRVS